MKSILKMVFVIVKVVSSMVQVTAVMHPIMTGVVVVVVAMTPQIRISSDQNSTRDISSCK